MKSAVLVLLFAIAVRALPVDDSIATRFAAWKVQFNKVYSTAETEQKALSAFVVNLARIDKLNENEPFKPFGLTKFSDMTNEEFKATMLMPDFTPTNDPNVPVADTASMPKDLPDSFDWRDKNAVTPVKDQGQCGSCWAFSADENIESINFLQGKNPLTDLSVQQIVACDVSDAGCDGGDLPTAFKYVMRAKGLESEKDYPYSAGGGTTGTCKVQPSKIVANITGYEYATRTLNETAMQVYVYNTAPLAVCVDAETWDSYTGGIITKSCGRSLDHCVMITGWGIEGTTKYWTVRNSWNTDWGEKGYLRVEIGRDLCGISQEAMSTYIK